MTRGPEDPRDRSTDEPDGATFEDRLLEIGLEEVVGDAAPPDLSARILDAAAKRQRTAASNRDAKNRKASTASDGSHRVARGHREPARVRHRRTAILVAAAAILATVTIATLVLRNGGSTIDPNEVIADRDTNASGTGDRMTTDPTSPPDPSRSETPDSAPTPDASPRYVRFETPLIGLEGNDMREYSATTLVAGDVLVHKGDEPTTMHFGDGATLTLAPRTMLEFTSPVEPVSTAIEPLRARVLAGKIDVATGDAERFGRPWLLELPAGELRVAASSRAWILVDRYREAESSDTFLANLPEIVRTTRNAWHDTIVRVYEGEADGILSDVDVALAAGEEASMWFGRPPVLGDMLSDNERHTLEAELTSIRLGDNIPEQSPEFYRLSQQADRDAEALRLRLEEWPAAWNFVRPKLFKLLESPQRTDRYRAYGILFDDPHPWTRGMLEEEPDEDLWEPDVLMQLANRGSKFARQRLGVWVEARSPELRRQVYAALWLALRDDDAGRRVMRKATESKTEFLFDSNAYFASAAGLALLGNPEPWRRGIGYLREEAERLRPRDDAESIDVRTLRAAYFHRALFHEPIELLSMDDPVLDFIDARRDALADPANLESAITALEIP